MKTITIQNLRRAALLGVTVAGLVVSTAACGSKKESSKEADATALLEKLLDAAQSGNDDLVRELIDRADPQVIGEIAPEIGFIAPEITIPESAPAAPQNGDVANGDAVNADAAPEAGAESAPEAGTVAPQDDAAVAAEDDDHNDLPNAGGGFDLGGLDLGNLFPAGPDFTDLGGAVDPTPNLDVIGALRTAAPTVQSVSFSGFPGVVRTTVRVLEGGVGANDIVSVKVIYTVAGDKRVETATRSADTSETASRWSVIVNTVDNAPITIVVTDVYGNETVHNVRVDVGIL